MKPPPFLARSFSSARTEARCDHAVGDDAGEEARGGVVHRLGERGEVAERALRVGAARAHVRERRGRELLPLHLVRARQLGRERHGERRARGRDVLERGRRREAGGELRFAHELPGVQRIEHVDVGGVAVQHLERLRRRIERDGLGEALVGVGAVLQLHRYSRSGGVTFASHVARSPP